jgi:HKD family nuclease
MDFWQQAKTQNGDKACEIDLTIRGDSLFVYRKAYSYEKAVREVLDELTQKVETKIYTSKQSGIRSPVVLKWRLFHFSYRLTIKMKVI